MADPITLYSGSYGGVWLNSGYVLEAYKWEVKESSVQRTGIHYFNDGGYAWSVGGSGDTGSDPKRHVTGTITLLRNFSQNTLFARPGDLIGPVFLFEHSHVAFGWYFTNIRIGDISEAVSGDSGDPIGYSFPFASHGLYDPPGVGVAATESIKNEMRRIILENLAREEAGKNEERAG